MRKLLLLVVALALGGLAAVLTAQYIQDARSSIQAEAEPVEVLVAQDDIPRGLSAEDLLQRKLVTKQAVPARYVAAGAVSSSRNIEGQVLAVPLSKGEQVTSGRFQYPSAAGLAYSVPDDYIAIALPYEEVRGVGGLVKPGDQVVVVATVKPEKPNPPVTRILVPRARVLAVGAAVGVERETAETESGEGLLASNNEQGSTKVAGSLTIALSPMDVEKVVFAQENGSVWLGLLKADAADIQKTPGQTMLTLWK